MKTYLIKDDGSFIEVVENEALKVAEFIQCLQTIKGEQSFLKDNGLDFLNIVNGRVVAEIDINNIAERYKAYFKTNIVKTYVKDKKLYIDIIITLNSGINKRIKLDIGG